MVKIEIFLNEKNCPQPLLVNIKWLWKLALGVDLIMVLHKGNKKRQKVKQYLHAKLTLQWNHFNNSWCLCYKVMSSCFIYFLSCQKLKQEARSPFPHTFQGVFFRAQTTVPIGFFQPPWKSKANFPISKTIYLCSWRVFTSTGSD